jgi:hypothetical protein
MKKKQLFAILIAMCIFFSMNMAIGQTKEAVNVRVVFPFEAANVLLHLWTPCCSTYTLEITGENEFSVDLPGIFNLMMFNIEFDVPEHFLTSWWIGGGNTYSGTLEPNRFDAHGLKYGKIYINDQLLDNRYTVVNGNGDGLNIYVKIDTSNGAISPHTSATFVHQLIDDRIPAEVHHHTAYLNTSLPQPEHVKIAGWATAITDNNILNDSQIEIDFIKLYGRKNNQLTLLTANDYLSFDPENDGGLYYRYPFFPYTHDWHDPMPGSVSNGILTINTSQNRMKVWHWWTHTIDSPNGFDYDSYKLVCKMRITGHSMVQLGIDFKDQWWSIDELGVSDWHFHNNGQWQEVVFDTQDFLNATQIEIPLFSVWNAISSYIEPLNPDLTAIISQLGDNFIVFQNLDSVYYPQGGVIDITSWDYQSGYLIKMNSDDILTFSGTYPDNRVLNLQNGWNIIPVLSSEPQQITQLFVDNLDKVIIIKEIIGTKVFWPVQGIMDLDELTPMKSYLIKSNASFSVTFD